MKKKKLPLRHKLVWGFFTPPVRLLMWLKFGYRARRAKNLPDKYIVLSNHLTDYDPILVGLSFPQMYFVGSEHIARWGFVSKFLKWGFDPILRYKGMPATSAIMNILRKIKLGGNVAMFAEGVRSWDGMPSPIAPTTGQLIKNSGVALVTYKITGGYFISPMWSGKNTRRGKSFGEVVDVYTKEELAEMSVEDINRAIKRDLWEDAYETQQKEMNSYKGKRLAEGFENLLFICPSCKKIETIRSEDCTAYCTNCNFKLTYTELGMLKGAPFNTCKELAAWQKEELNTLAQNSAVFSAEDAELVSVKDHEEELVDKGTLTLSRDFISVGNTEVSLDAITEFSMHGKHSLVFSGRGFYYEINTTKSTNTLRFLLLYNSYAAMRTEKETSGVV